MITRKIKHELMECAAEYPAVTIVGPRQSGKTTLAKMTFPKRPYVTLEDPDIRRQATGTRGDFWRVSSQKRFWMKFNERRSFSAICKVSSTQIENRAALFSPAHISPWSMRRFLSRWRGVRPY